jgi:hypothetical protein
MEQSEPYEVAKDHTNHRWSSLPEVAKDHTHRCCTANPEPMPDGDDPRYAAMTGAPSSQQEPLAPAAAEAKAPRLTLEDAMAWCQEKGAWIRPTPTRWVVSAYTISGTGHDLVEAVMECQAEMTRIAHVWNAMIDDMTKIRK